jgi:hypothetical protein
MEGSLSAESLPVRASIRISAESPRMLVIVFKQESTIQCS